MDARPPPDAAPPPDADVPSAAPGSLAEMRVAAVMAQWPATTRVFLRWRMACPGCLIADLETVDAAARAYRAPLDALVRALEASISGESPPAE